MIVPHTTLQPDTAAALDATGWKWTPVDVSWHDGAYWSLLATLWDAGETFAIVEHDVIVEPDTLDRLARCPEAWCAHPTPYLHGEHVGMGCVKFTDRLIAARPQAVEEVGDMHDLQHPRRHWCRLDAWLQTMVLPHTGVQRHVHQPALRHVRPYETVPMPTHGCMSLTAPVL